MDTFWHKQTPSEPLFPEMIWNKPENRSLAGKLLIVGGNLHAVSKVAQAYEYASKHGAGEVKVALPDSLKKTVGSALPSCEFVESTPSGSFALKSKNSLLAFGNWADAVLFCGDLGHNSETAVLLEQFMKDYSAHITLANDALDYFLSHAEAALSRPKTVLVMTIAELQAMCKDIRWPTPITFSMGLVQLAKELHELTGKYPASIVMHYEANFVCAHAGQVCTTPSENGDDLWRTLIATKASVDCMQNPTKTFEALATALIN